LRINGEVLHLIRHSQGRVTLKLLLSQCCGIRDVYSGFPYPDFYPSQIPDLGSRIQKQQQKRGPKKICCHTFFSSHNFHKVKNYFIFEILKILPLSVCKLSGRDTPKLETKLNSIYKKTAASLFSFLSKSSPSHLSVLCFQT